jgi:DNA-binding MarR family transcriptional regulator
MNNSPMDSLELAQLLDGFALVRSRLIESITSPHGVSATSWSILTALADQSQSLTPSELAQLTALPRSTVTGVLHRLEEQGRCTRSTKDSDRRRHLIELTSSGRQQVELLRAKLKQSRQKDLAALTPDQIKDLGELILAVAQPQTTVER